MIKPLHIKNFTKPEDSVAYVGTASELGLTAGPPLLIHIEGLNPNKLQHAYAFNLVSKDEQQATYRAQPTPLLQGDNRPTVVILNS